MKVAKTLAIITALGASLVLLGSGVGAWWLLQPVSMNADQAVSIEIPRGSSQRRIGEILYNAGLIRHPLSLRLATQILGNGAQLQAGVYEVRSNLNALDISKQLTRNTRDQRVTLPEGLRAEEVVTSLAEQLNVPAQPAEACLTQNGYLYPETYSFLPGTSVETACQRLRGQFDIVWSELTSRSATPSGYSQADLVTLAALVQREAKDPEDMKRVAGILYNRLDLGMPLQIDATLQYAKGYDERNDTWWPTPLAADKTLRSPYNTYQNPGLPAGPISNPGREALQAVLTPIASDNLYYISTLDGSEMFFAPTYEEHQANVNRYLR